MTLSNYRTAIRIISILIIILPLCASNSWIPMDTPEGYHEFQFIENYGENIVWAIGAESAYTTPKYLFKSTDGGESWTLQHTFDYKISELVFIDANIGFALQYSSIYKTVDGGDTWTLLSSVAGIGCLDIVSENILWGASPNSYYAYKSVDGGGNWTTQTLPTSARGEYITAFNNDRAWVGGDKFSYTIDAGTTWQSRDFATGDLVMTSANTGYAIFGGLKKTTDNGENWSVVKSLDYSDMRIYALDDQSVWLVNRYGVFDNPIFRTIDGGNTWQTHSYYNASPYKMYDVCASDTNLAWAAGNDGIYKYGPAPDLTLLYPNAGDDLYAGETAQISWEAQSIAYLDIYYTTNGSNWILVEDSVDAAPGAYYWQVPALTSQQCKIKLEPTKEQFQEETTESDGYFSITIPPISFKEFDLYDQCNFSENNPLNVFAKGIPIRLKVKVKNNLTQNLLSASGTLSTSNPYITLNSNSSSYNNILVNSEEWSSSEFEFTIANNAPNEFVVDFELELNDQIVTGGPWTTSFSLPVILDPFDIGLVLIDDDSNPDSQGDNDDVVEPGEHVEIIPLLNNVSNNEYDNVEGELFSTSDEIEVWDFKNGASGVVYSHYPYNVVSGSQEIVSALQTNIMPEQDFVLTYGYNETFSFPLQMQITADVPKYDNMEMRWAKEFTINSSYPVVGIKDIVPDNFYLSNYPNPFNPATTISYQLPMDSKITLNVYDLSGLLIQTLADGQYEAGNYSINFNAGDLPSGVYLYRLNAGNSMITRKMVLMK